MRGQPVRPIRQSTYRRRERALSGGVDSDGQTIKWVLADENDAAKVTVDDFLIDQATAAASIDASLTAFLAGAALPIANGGTASTSAANALVALGALALAGGTMTGNIVRSGKGIHPYFSNASMTGGRIFIQAAGADPTSLAGRHCVRVLNDRPHQNARRHEHAPHHRRDGLNPYPHAGQREHATHAHPYQNARPG
jgi:hypothetical protein